MKKSIVLKAFIASCIGVSVGLPVVCQPQQAVGNNMGSMVSGGEPKSAPATNDDSDRRSNAIEEDLDEEDLESMFDQLAMTIEELDALKTLPGELGKLPATPAYPENNHPTAARIELGKKLYFDKRLSRDHSMSCATCHDPAKGWADGRARAAGWAGKELGRHSPTVINTAYNTAQFWDGRADTLEQQALGPLLAEGEMNMISADAVIELLQTAPEYRGAFEEAYGEGATWENVGRAIAAFERTVVTGPSRFDHYVGGDKSALSDSEKRGLILFATTASCTACHKGPNFTDSKFYALGVKQEGPLSSDEGRFVVTKNEADKYAFKTPGLRNLTETAPYMHDGSLATLEEVVEFYNRGGVRHDRRSKLVQPLNLTEPQKEDLVNFLKALTGPMPKITLPPGEHFGI